MSVFFNVINGWKMYRLENIRENCWMYVICHFISQIFKIFHFCHENMSMWSFNAEEKVLHSDISSAKLLIDRWQKIMGLYWQLAGLKRSHACTCIKITESAVDSDVQKYGKSINPFDHCLHPDVATVVSQRGRREWLTNNWGGGGGVGGKRCYRQLNTKFRRKHLVPLTSFTSQQGFFQ